MTDNKSKANRFKLSSNFSGKMPPPPGVPGAGRQSGFTSGPVPGVSGSRFTQGPAAMIGGRFNLKGVAAAAMTAGGLPTSHNAHISAAQNSQKKKIRIDDQGRIVDEKGKVVEMQREAELMVNQKQGAAGSRIGDGAGGGSGKPDNDRELQNQQELLKKRTFYDSSLES